MSNDDTLDPQDDAETGGEPIADESLDDEALADEVDGAAPDMGDEEEDV
jgi:hypothetical protein